MTERLVEIFYPNMQTKRKLTEVNGKRHGEYKEWHKNGQLRTHCFFHHGKIHGEYKQWRRDGQPLGYHVYHHGELYGEYKTWYSNGSLERHCFYSHLHIHGECKLLQEDGTLIHHGLWIHGNQVIDFLEQPELFPTTEGARLSLKLKYGDAPFLPNQKVKRATQ